MSRSGLVIRSHHWPISLGDVRVALSLVGSLPTPRLCLTDAAYTSDGLRQFPMECGTRPVPPTIRHGIERAICCLKDFRRVATRYDGPAQYCLAAIHIAAIVALWGKGLMLALRAKKWTRFSLTWPYGSLTRPSGSAPTMRSSKSGASDPKVGPLLVRC